jgi:hypothetical protein
MAPAQSTTNNQQETLARYTLLNDHNEPQDGYYIDLLTWPSAGSNDGTAVYVDEDGTRDMLAFTLDRTRRVLRTHHVRAPAHQFDVTPVLDNGEVVQLLMDLGQNDTATFVLYPEDFEQRTIEEDLDMSFPCLDTVEC